MKKMTKKNLILGGILAALVLSAYIFNGPFAKWQKSLNKPKNFVSGFQVNDINKIEIENAGKKTVVEKTSVNVGSSTEEKWKIAGTKDFYLNKDATDKLGTSIRELLAANLDLVSENKDKKKEFKVDDSGLSVVLKKADTVAAEFVIGKMTGDYSGVYLSKKDFDQIFSVKIASLDFVFSDDNLYDKTILDVDSGNINKIRFQHLKQEFIIEKKDDKWVGISPKAFAVNKDKISNIINLMSSLKAVEVPVQDFKGTGLEKHEIIVQVSGSGIDNTIFIGNKNDKDLYYAKTGASDNIYLISKDNRDALNKTIADLK